MVAAYAFNCPPKRGIVDNLDRPCTTPARLWAWGPVLATRIEVSTPVTSILRGFGVLWSMEQLQQCFSRCVPSGTNSSVVLCCTVAPNP
eukprot:517189-Pyramimonas_sp.AAC.1